MRLPSRYLKFQIPYAKIYEILKNGKYKRIIFHIDLPSISRGFYNRQVIEYEIAEYIDKQQMPSYFLMEGKQFLGELFERFKQYTPRFSIFYDNGNCGQNNSIYKGYKDRSRDRSKLILEDLDMELYSNIKNYYYEQFAPMFTIPPMSKVTFLKSYEADFVPWIMLKYNIWDCNNPETLNIILSVDKDLLQCCQYQNVIQIFTLFSKNGSGIVFNIYDDTNAINQLYDKSERGILTSKYIPTILSLAGDKADKIPGIPRVGEANAYKMIINYNLPACLTDDFVLPDCLVQHKDIIKRNYKLISFDEQLSRIPLPNLQEILNSFS